MGIGEKRLGITYFHETFGNRNKIERWFRELENRTKRFYNNINAKALKSIEEIATAVAVVHNLVRIEGSNTNLTVPNCIKLSKVFNTDLVRAYNILTPLVPFGIGIMGWRPSLRLNPQGGKCNPNLPALAGTLTLQGGEEVSICTSRRNPAGSSGTLLYRHPSSITRPRSPKLPSWSGVRPSGPTRGQGRHGL
jgi:hypothetical protein